MKTMKRKMKKGLAMLTAASLLAGMLSVMPGSEMVVQAADNTPSVTAFATPEQLMDSDNFALHEEEGSGVAQKVYFGFYNSNKQIWYIAGSDAADSIVLLCDPALPMHPNLGVLFQSNENNKTYTGSEDWGSYETALTQGTEVYANHYGASVLRWQFIKALETSAFNDSEQGLMLSTTIYTDDKKNSSIYKITDKLYPAYGDWDDDKYITVGENNAEALNGGIKVSLMSGPYASGGEFWLRAPYKSNNGALTALPGKWVKNYGVDYGAGVVPAFRLNLSSVIFASAATAATSDTAVTETIAEGTAMTFRLDGTDKVIGDVVYNPIEKLLVAKKDSSESETVSLVVQGKDGTNDWYYSKEITDTETVRISDIEEAVGSDIDLSTCKVWMETTINGMVYAKMVEEATNVNTLDLSIAAPVSETALATEASAPTTGLADTTPAINWTVDGNEVTGNADYDTSYTANITLDTEDTAYFAENVIATVNGQPANVTKNTDGTITVSYIFDTTAKGNISYTVTSFADIYDGQPHGVEVTVSKPAGVSVTYSEDGINYDTTAPTYTNAGEYTVHYKLEKSKYETVTDSKTVKINKRPLAITASDQTITYGDSIDESAYTVTGLAAGDSIVNLTLTPSTTDATDSGSIAVSMDRIVNAQGEDVTANYDIAYTDGALIIGNAVLPNTAVGYVGVYDGQTHGITVSAGDLTISGNDLIPNPDPSAPGALEGVIITYSEDGVNYTPTNPTYTNVGEYIVYYQLEKANYATVIGSKTVKITKRPLNLIAADQNIIYGNGINEAGYTITGLADGDSIQTVTLSPGTTDATDSGSITVSMDKVLNTGGVDVTANYDITCTAGNLVISRAAIVSTATGYEGAYDGQPHGITVDVTAPTDAVITYSTDGITYSSTAPTYTSVGEYTVYYKIEKPNYETVTGSRTVKITAVPETVYTILDGLNLEWAMNSEEAITIRGNGEFSDFVGIKVDGALVDATHYSVREGSTIVTLSNAYLRALGEGNHTFEMLWTNGIASTAFTVVSAGSGNGTTPNNPNPDDSQTTPGNPAPDNNQTTPGNPAPDDSQTTPDNSASDNSQTATNNAGTGNAGSASDELDDVPKTGDTTIPTGLLVIMLVAGMGMLVTAMKRRKSTK